ncbi:hypothetical protein FQN54_006015 [Arachnomyces sp. PD_36]|nr:hypothetical protein FQN54_006015 [Arachnomyces sp. PD_36]
MAPSSRSNSSDSSSDSTYDDVHSEFYTFSTPLSPEGDGFPHESDSFSSLPDINPQEEDSAPGDEGYLPKWVPLSIDLAGASLPWDIRVPEAPPSGEEYDESSMSSTERSFVHRRRPAEYVHRPPVWRIQSLKNSRSLSSSESDADTDLAPELNFGGQFDACRLCSAELLKKVSAGKNTSDFGKWYDHQGRSPLAGGALGYEEQLNAMASAWSEEPFVVAMASSSDPKDPILEEPAPEEEKGSRSKSPDASKIEGEAQHLPDPSNQESDSTPESDGGVPIIDTSSQVPHTGGLPPSMSRTYVLPLMTTKDNPFSSLDTSKPDSKNPYTSGISPGASSQMSRTYVQPLMTTKDNPFRSLDTSKLDSKNPYTSGISPGASSQSKGKEEKSQRRESSTSLTKSSQQSSPGLELSRLTSDGYGNKGDLPTPSTERSGQVSRSSASKLTGPVKGASAAASPRSRLRETDKLESPRPEKRPKLDPDQVNKEELESSTNYNGKGSPITTWALFRQKGVCTENILESYKDIRVEGSLDGGTYGIKSGSRVICVNDTMISSYADDQYRLNLGDAFIVLQMYGDLWASCLKLSLNNPVRFVPREASRGMDDYARPRLPEQIKFLPLCSVTLAENFGKYMKRRLTEGPNSLFPHLPCNGQQVIAPERNQSRRAVKIANEGGSILVPKSMANECTNIHRLPHGKLTVPKPDDNAEAYPTASRGRPPRSDTQERSWPSAQKTKNSFHEKGWTKVTQSSREYPGPKKAMTDGAPHKDSSPYSGLELPEPDVADAPRKDSSPSSGPGLPEPDVTDASRKDSSLSSEPGFPKPDVTDASRKDSSPSSRPGFPESDATDASRKDSSPSSGVGFPEPSVADRPSRGKSPEAENGLVDALAKHNLGSPFVPSETPEPQTSPTTVPRIFSSKGQAPTVDEYTQRLAAAHNSPPLSIHENPSDKAPVCGLIVHKVGDRYIFTDPNQPSSPDVAQGESLSHEQSPVQTKQPSTEAENPQPPQQRNPEEATPSQEKEAGQGTQEPTGGSDIPQSSQTHNTEDVESGPKDAQPSAAGTEIPQPPQQHNPESLTPPQEQESAQDTQEPTGQSDISQPSHPDSAGDEASVQGQGLAQEREPLLGGTQGHQPPQPGRMRRHLSNSVQRMNQIPERFRSSRKSRHSRSSGA